MTSGAFAPLLGCVVGTSQLGNPASTDDSGDASSSASATVDPADDGGTGMGPGGEASDGATASPTSAEDGATSQPTSATDGETSASSSTTEACDGTSEGCDDTEGAIGCDTFVQDCVAGQKCQPFADDRGNSWNNTRCVDIAAQPAQAGDPCLVEDYPTSGLDDCDLGLFCWPEGGGEGPWAGHCLPLCGGSLDEPTCPITFGCEIMWCFEECDPLASTCEEGFPCSFLSDQLLCLPGSDIAGDFGDPCMTFGDCDPGLVCIPGETHPAGCDTYACCGQTCDPSGTPCAEGECTPIGEDFGNVGACMVPS